MKEFIEVYSESGRRLTLSVSSIAVIEELQNGTCRIVMKEMDTNGAAVFIPIRGSYSGTVAELEINS